MYSFFDNYQQACLDSRTCQTQLFNIHGDSVREVSVFSLSTVGVTWMLSVDGKGVIASSANPNGFAFTVTSWTGI